MIKLTKENIGDIFLIPIIEQEGLKKEAVLAEIKEPDYLFLLRDTGHQVWLHKTADISLSQRGTIEPLKKPDLEDLQREIDVLRNDFQNLESLFHDKIKSLEAEIENLSNK